MSNRGYYDDNQSGQGGDYGGERRQEGGYGSQNNNDDSYGGQDDGGRRQQGGYEGVENEYSGRPVEQGRHNNYGGGAGYSGGDVDDLSGAAEHAERHAGSSGESSIFSSVLSSLSQNKQHIGNSNLNEQDAVQSHQQFFGGGGGGGGQANSGSMGAAAAMQALKMFSGGSSGNTQKGNSQNAFVGMAMAEASKLFDHQSSQGNVSNANKESTVQKAGEMALKMFMKSQMQGGGGSSGASGLMSMASKFL
ncbi:uncharacterized protein RSE6_07565 [Rhynchosporium secalis]|uniref:DUF7721 domain-containing protein n=1 Tax=Rhynchosporium secalis TaxID=38038 RepID=A0A1E1MD75_RHYSE|nr:uncharacterized protein RSE6_07565 [Rhynchosporium secalis]